MIYAASHYDVFATGITVSQRQAELAGQRIRSAGLEGRCTVRLCDYRDVEESESYDKIASIGMFEHVGEHNFPRYFGKIYRALKPGGWVLNHGITQNLLGAESLGSGIGDFVEEYVFPGGQLVHVSRVIQGMASEGLEVIDAEGVNSLNLLNPFDASPEEADSWARQLNLI